MLASTRDVVGAALYALSCVIIVAFGEGMRRARRRADAMRSRLAGEVEQRRVTEEERAKVLARLDALVTHAPVGIALFDADLRFVRVNEHAAAIDGIPIEAHIGRTVGELLPGVADTVEAMLRRVRDTGEAIRGVEVSGETPAQPGRARHWIANYYPVNDANGALFGVGAVALEVTATREAQQALRETDRRKDEFVATLAHELRNPLAAIRNAVLLLRRQSIEAHVRTEVIDIVDRQSMHVVRLVEDLLDLARIRTGKLELRRERVAVTAIVAAAVEAVRPMVEASRHELTVALAPDPMFVQGDATRLAQVLQNLLANAARYTEPGGRIVLTAERRGEDIVLSVRDNGAGIAPQMLSRVFDLFEQAGTAFSGGEGLGIGLALVRQLIGAHGVCVDARSDGRGCGSTFTVKLPAAAPDNGPDRHGARGNARRVLVVEPLAVHASVIAAQLRSRGDEVVVAHDGPSGVAAVAALKPDVVLLDVGFDGYEAFARIREQPGGRRICVVARVGAHDSRTDGDGGDAPFAELLSLIDKLFRVPRTTS